MYLSIPILVFLSIYIYIYTHIPIYIYTPIYTPPAQVIGDLSGLTETYGNLFQLPPWFAYVAKVRVGGRVVGLVYGLLVVDGYQ